MAKATVGAAGIEYIQGALKRPKKEYDQHTGYKPQGPFGALFYLINTRIHVRKLPFLQTLLYKNYKNILFLRKR